MRVTPNGIGNHLGESEWWEFFFGRLFPPVSILTDSYDEELALQAHDLVKLLDLHPIRISQLGLNLNQLSTQTIMKLNLAQYQNINVVTAQPSPFDLALEQEEVSADALLDLDPDQLGTLPIGGDYVLTEDLELMNPSLSADNLLDLKVGELGDIPVGVGK